ncbi:MAG TPA: outer membrane beta-barrel protein [Gemmatimonas sp.]|nr:outer membrane beta-barrel protein [Gemmatimonas sp.]
MHMTRCFRFAASLFALFTPVVLQAQSAPATSTGSQPSTIVEPGDVMRPFIKGTRNVSLGYMAAGEYQGHGAGIMLEKGMLSLSPRLHVGVGGFLGVQRNTETFGETTVRSTSVPLMGIANMHLAPISMPRLDLYGGLSAGFTRTSLDTDAVVLPPGDEAGTEFSLAIQAGARYALSQRSSLLVQIGLGDLPLLFAGASFKF